MQSSQSINESRSTHILALTEDSLHISLECLTRTKGLVTSLQHYLGQSVMGPFPFVATCSRHIELGPMIAPCHSYRLRILSNHPFIGFDRLSCHCDNLLPCDQGQHSNLTLRYHDLLMARVFFRRADETKPKTTEKHLLVRISESLAFEKAHFKFQKCRFVQRL